MRIATGAFFIALLFNCAGITFAGSHVPDLKGTWRGEFTIVRTVPPRNAGPNPLAFTKPGVHTAKGVTYVIEKQEGPLFSGIESFGKSKQAVTGAIQHDNKKFYMVDRYGMFIGEIISPDTIRIIYLENTKHGQVAAHGTLTRK